MKEQCSPATRLRHREWLGERREEEGWRERKEGRRGSQVNDFSTEADWDTLVVDGNNHSGSNDPVGVPRSAASTLSNLW